MAVVFTEVVAVRTTTSVNYDNFRGLVFSSDVNRRSGIAEGKSITINTNGYRLIIICCSGFYYP